jgi:hypothetical protein
MNRILVLIYILTVTLAVLFSCQSNITDEPGLYLLKSCVNSDIENGVFLKISKDSIEISQYGSIFLSDDYRLWLTAEINSEKTDTDSITYAFSKSKNNNSIFTIIEPNKEFDFEMVKIEIENITELNSVESLKGKRFSLLRDSLIKIYFFTDQHLVYKAKGTNPDFQKWYSTPWIDSRSLMLDGIYRNFLQIREDEELIYLYSPYQEKVVAVEDKIEFRREILIDSTKLAGTWTKLEPPVDGKFLPLKIRPKTVKFEQGQLIHGRDTIYYFLDLATGFIDLQHDGGSVIVDLSIDTMKLVGGDLNPFSFQANNLDTIIYIKKSAQ